MRICNTLFHEAKPHLISPPQMKQIHQHPSLEKKQSKEGSHQPEYYSGYSQTARQFPQVSDQNDAPASEGPISTVRSTSVKNPINQQLSSNSACKATRADKKKTTNLQDLFILLRMGLLYFLRRSYIPLKIANSMFPGLQSLLK